MRCLCYKDVYKVGINCIKYSEKRKFKKINSKKIIKFYQIGLWIMFNYLLINILEFIFDN